MKISTGLFIGIAVCVAFSLGRLAALPQPKPTRFAEPKLGTNWYEAYPEVPQWQLAQEEQEARQRRTEMVLRAHYLNAMREQAIRRQQQWIDAELEARRINSRVGDYDPKRWDNPYRY